MAASPSFAATPKLGLVQIVNADASNQKTILTAGSSGAKIVGVNAVSDDTSARVLTLSVLRSAVSYPISVVSVAAGSGTDGSAPATDLLKESLLPLPVDNDGQRYLLLEAGDVLQVKSGSTVTSAKAVTVAAIAADF